MKKDEILEKIRESIGIVIKEIDMAVVDLIDSLKSILM